jgi:hypothetical protein
MAGIGFPARLAQVEAQVTGEQRFLEASLPRTGWIMTTALRWLFRQLELAHRLSRLARPVRRI